MSQTWLTTGVTGKVRKCLAEQARPSQVVLEITPEPSVRTSASGHGRGERSGPRPWDTLAQRVSDTPTSPTSYSAAANFTAKSKNLAFFAVWQQAEAGWRLGARRRSRLRLIAQ